MAASSDTLLPPNATALERAIARTIAARFDALTAPYRQLWSPTDCPVKLLPWLAGTLGVDGWDASWPEAVRRSRIAASIAIHRQQGTIGAVESVVSAYGGNVVLTMWHDMTPVGTPFTFALSVALGGQSGAAPSAAFIDAMIADVTRAKGARDIFTFTAALNTIGSIGLVGAARSATYARLECQA